VSSITHHWNQDVGGCQFHPRLASELKVAAQEMIGGAEEQPCVDLRWNAHRPPRRPLSCPCLVMRVHAVTPHHSLTSRLLREFLPAHQILLLVLHQLQRRGVQRLLQLGEVDLYVCPSASALVLASASHAPWLVAPTYPSTSPARLRSFVPPWLSSAWCHPRDGVSGL
jgi:hypothetical protein